MTSLMYNTKIVKFERKKFKSNKNHNFLCFGLITYFMFRDK